MILLSHLSALLLASSIQGAPAPWKAPSQTARIVPQEERAEVIASNFSDVDGGLHQLGLRGAAAAVVLVFLDPRSGDVEPLLDEIKRASEEAEELGIEFYGVLSSASVSVSDGRAFGAGEGLTFPLLFDASGELASRLMPNHMPECFVVSKYDALVYRGRIEAMPGEAGGGLRAAQRAVAGGELPAEPEQVPSGGAFEYWPSNLNELDLTYTRNIAPILEANCVDCHRSGDVAPFALDTYRKVKRRARMLIFACEDGIMPPWQANPRVNLFREHRSVSARQIAIMRSWADAKSPEGQATDLLPRQARFQAEWRLGEPDMILSAPDFDLPAEGADVFQNYVIPAGLLEGRMLIGLEFKPGAISVVHHMSLYLDSTGTSRALDEADPGPGFSAYGAGVPAGQEGASRQAIDAPMIRAWLPGQGPYQTPEGLGVPISPGSDFVISTHYHLDGTAATDRTRIGVYFGDASTTRNMFLSLMATDEIDIPAGEKRYKRHVLAKLPAAATFINITPHMHALGSSVNLWVTPPGGERMHLLEVPRWDYRWQHTYTFHEPIYFPKGTLFEAVHFFDNSADNPDNPSDPPSAVTGGWFTFDEMCMLHFNLVPDHNPKKSSAFYLRLSTTLKAE